MPLPPSLTEFAEAVWAQSLTPKGFLPKELALKIAFSSLFRYLLS
jgi:hypothetical protein